MTDPKTPLSELAWLFFRLGLTAFGGPAAHIAMFRDEVVKRRQWLTDDVFVDLLGATNLIPGPNSTEMAIHIGYLRGGWKGLLVTGTCFILPAAIIVGILAHLYVMFGSLPAVGWLLYGIKPVIIAVIVQAIWGLSKSAVKNISLGILGIGVFVLYILGGNEIVLLFGSALGYMLYRNFRNLSGNPSANLFVPFGVPFAIFQAVQAVPFSLPTLFFTFLKIGSVLYGSGYVLLAFLRNDFVERLGWITNQQLLDAIAIGQFTPGPVFTTATFVGYLVGGIAGAILATIGIFLPAFVFVYLSSPFIPRLRQSKWLSALLDGVNVAALGLMGAVTVTIIQNALVDIPTIGLAIVSAVLFIRYKVNSTWLIILGGIVGIILGVINQINVVS